MQILRRFLFLIPALLALHSGAQTFSIYSTLGEPGDTYNANSGWLVNGSANPPEPFVGEAFAFIAGSSGFLSQINIALSAGNSTPATDLANIFIAGNNPNSNLPGGTLESFLNVSVSGPFGAPNPIVSLNSVANPLLQSGKPYWLYVTAALPGADIIVNQNSLGVSANQAQEFSPNAWSAKGFNPTFAFNVEVTAVPEPSTVALAALGISILMGPLSRRFHFNSGEREE